MPSDPAANGARFDRWASTYDASPLQPALFAPVHQTTLQLAQQHLPDARRVLDVGCGTGRLLRQARQRYWWAELVGVDLARGMVAAAIAATSTKLGIRYIRAGAEHLPFTEEVFDLVFATMSMRHWTDRAAGIAEISRVLIPGGMLVLADVFPSSPRPTLLGSMLLRRRRPSLPGELDAALTAHRLAIVDCNHTPWFSLPDAQVVAAQRQSTPSRPFGGVERPRRVVRFANRTQMLAAKWPHSCTTCGSPVPAKTPDSTALASDPW